MSGLTERQIRVLRTMADKTDGLGCAYRLGVSMATMEALANRKLVVPHSKVGWSFSPRTADWRITDAGRAAIAKATGAA